MSKQTVIRYESELAREFQQLVASESDLHWRLDSGSDLSFSLDARTLRFRPVFSLKPSFPELESFVRTSGPGDPRPILIAPELSPRVLDFCRQHQLNALDLNGRVYLRAEGLLVDRCALPGRNFRFELEPRNIFVGKSARIVRSLLTDRDRVWGQSELVSRIKASSGLVSRIARYLLHQGFIEKKSAREFRVREPLALLDAWAESDNFARRTKTVRYSVFGGSLMDLAYKLRHLAAGQSLSIAFTQWTAAWLRHPYTEPVVVSAYVPQLPSDSVLNAIDLRMVNDAGKVWLHVPEDEGVFLETQTVKELPLVSDAQIYLDLLKTGLRGPDQAIALRNWEGFCRP